MENVPQHIRPNVKDYDMQKCFRVDNLWLMKTLFFLRAMNRFIVHFLALRCFFFSFPFFFISTEMRWLKKPWPWPITDRLSGYFSRARGYVFLRFFFSLSPLSPFRKCGITQHPVYWSRAGTRAILMTQNYSLTGCEQSRVSFVRSSSSRSSYRWL